MAPQSDTIRALRALVRGRDDLVAARVQLANQLRELLQTYWAGAAEVFADIDSPIALAFIRDSMDRRLRTAHDIEASFQFPILAHVRKRVPVYAGTGAETTREAIRLTRMAEREGVDGVSIAQFARGSRADVRPPFPAACARSRES